MSEEYTSAAYYRGEIYYEYRYLTEEIKKQLDYMIAQRRCPHRHPCVSFHDEDTRDYLAAAIAALGPDALHTCGKNGLVTDLRGYIGRRAITFRALTPSP